MNELGMYLLKSSIWIAAFWLIWRLFLHNERFFRFNRFFLFLGLLTSLILPFCKYTYVQKLILPLSNSLPTSEAATTAVAGNSINLGLIALAIYVLGVIGFSAYFVFGILKINKMAKNAVIQEDKNLKILNSSEIESSFSFMNYIFMNNYPGISEMEKKIVLLHEQIHAGQKHWIDTLMAQFLLIMQWFNPFMYLYLRAIKQNHEFLADEAVLNEGNSPAVYQAVLINSTLKAPVFSFANSFAYPDKKKRIQMMKKKTCNQMKKAATLLLVPALAVFLWAFSEKKYEISFIQTEEDENVRVLGAARMSDSLLNKDLYVNLESDSLKKIKRGVKVLVSDNSAEIQMDTIDVAKNVVVVGFGRTDEDIPQNLPTVKSYSMRVHADSLIKGAQSIPNTEVKELFVSSSIGFSTLQSKQPLTIVDGEVVASLDAILPSEIESVTVLKDSAALAVYGASAKNGVVALTTKNAKKESFTINTDSLVNIGKGRVTISEGKRKPLLAIRALHEGNNTPPLFIVDGQEVKSIENIESEAIESITILKDASSTKIYGDKGANGVIVIEIKK